jgi:predicted RNase H-like nuclease (RuvC/YqgF family)
LDSWKLEFNASLTQIKETIKDEVSRLKKDTADLKNEIINIRKEYREIKSEIDKVDRKQIEMRKEITQLQQSAQYTSDTQDEYKRKLDSLTDDVKNLDSLQLEINKIKIQNKHITSLLNLNDQRERLLNIEVVGMPEIKNENPSELIMKICKHIGVSIMEGDILQVNRVSPRIKIQGRPRVIIAKLKTRLLKDSIISLGRKNRLNTKDIGITGEAKPIYINEHLTPHNKQLLKKCKEIAKNKEYQFVWSKNGRIFIRQNDTAPALQIFDEEDIIKKIQVVK